MNKKLVIVLITLVVCVSIIILLICAPWVKPAKYVSPSKYKTLVEVQKEIRDAIAAYEIGSIVEGKGTISYAKDLQLADAGCVSGVQACNKEFTAGSTVTLTGTPAPGWRLSGWVVSPSGNGGSDCSGTTGACTVTVNSATSVHIVFVERNLMMRQSG